MAYARVVWATRSFVALAVQEGTVGPERDVAYQTDATFGRSAVNASDAGTVRMMVNPGTAWRRWQCGPVARRVAQICRWAGVIAILLLAWIGFLHLTRGTAVRHVRGVGADGVPVGISEAEFPLSIALLTGTPLSAGNRVEVALNGDGTYEGLWSELRFATRSITLQLYYGNRGKVADTLHGILLDRAAAGVRVFVLYDAFGTVNMPRERVDSLRRAGVKVEPFRPLRISALHLAQNRSHARGIVVDGRVGRTGGLGMDDKWLRDGRSNGSSGETNVRFEGPAVTQLQAALAAAWTEATGVLFTGRVTERGYADGVTAGLLYATPTLGSTAAERFLAASLSGAPDGNMVELFAAAAGRGVDVRLLTASPRTDVRTVRFAGRALYERLLESGVRIFNGNQPRYMERHSSQTAGRPR